MKYLFNLSSTVSQMTVVLGALQMLDNQRTSNYFLSLRETFSVAHKQ